MRRLHLDSELLAATAVVAIVLFLLVPLPPLLLDLLLAFNLGLAFLLLASALLLEDSLDLSAFPSLLLVSTLLRLSLNISSTRLILSRGEAGQVIGAFGRFVAADSVLVGVAIFAILMVVQLVVVAKGAERVAEVGARFTLDAMPGKQLAVDADLRSGACTQEEAKLRRSGLEQESRFYGALDGAMKFVKGDAIAGLVITALNVCGGLGQAILVQGMSWEEALSKVTVLSIGDGLVSALPALLTSVSAGVVVTRVASSGKGKGVASELLRQLLGNPRALGLAGGLLAVVGLLPGFPMLPFSLVSLTLCGLAFQRRRVASPAPGQEEDHLSMAASPGSPGPSLGSRPNAVPRLPSAVPSPANALAPTPPVKPRASSALCLRIGSCPEPQSLEALRTELLPRLRDRVGQRYGVTLPAFELGSSRDQGFSLYLHGAPLEAGPWPSKAAALVHAADSELFGFGGERVLLGKSHGILLSPEDLVLASEAGLPIVSVEEARLAILEGAVSKHLGILLSLQATAALLAPLEQRAPALYEATLASFELGDLQALFRSLLEEGIGIGALEPLLESLHGIAPSALQDEGVAAARRALGRQLVASHLHEGQLPLTVLEPLSELQLRESLLQTPKGLALALCPEDSDRLLKASTATLQLPGAVLAVQRDLRRPLFEFFRAALPPTDRPTVLALEELPPELPLMLLGQLSLPDSREGYPSFEGSPPGPGSLLIGGEEAELPALVPNLSLSSAALPSAVTADRPLLSAEAP